MDVSSDNKQYYEKRRRQFYLGGLFLVALITVFEVAFHYDDLVAATLYFVTCLIFGIGPLAWCIYDGLSRGFRMSFHRWVLWLLLGPFVVVAYFSKTRELTTSVRWLFGLALYLPYYAVSFAVWYLTGEALVKLGYFSED